MEQKNNEQKTAQILYITIIMVLLIMAVTVGLVTAANKAMNPAVTTATTTTASSAMSEDAVVTTKAPEVTTADTTAKVIEIVTTEKTTAATTTERTTAVKPTVAEPVEPTLPTFSMPAEGNVSVDFSIDVLVYSNTMEDYRTHNGIDICATLGSAVTAAADGIVTDVYEHPMMGYTVVVSHDGGAETVYQNLDDDITVFVGDVVKCGDVLGAVGESAIIEIAEEPHLHFEMCIAGERVNPLDYIEATEAVMSYEE
ncbi:MAG: M23 family metallopeptidase [Clostridia bacterium]|nr:M23 family metallopeptidase [Clostridia bacterium]